MTNKTKTILKEIKNPRPGSTNTHYISNIETPDLQDKIDNQTENEVDDILMENKE